MKTFCTEGPVDPARNYFVSRKSLLKQGLAKVDDWRYFTLFAPRQTCWRSTRGRPAKYFCRK